MTIDADISVTMVYLLVAWLVVVAESQWFTYLLLGW